MGAGLFHRSGSGAPPQTAAVPWRHHCAVRFRMATGPCAETFSPLERHSGSHVDAASDKHLGLRLQITSGSSCPCQGDSGAASSSSFSSSTPPYPQALRSASGSSVSWFRGFSRLLYSDSGSVELTEPFQRFLALVRRLLSWTHAPSPRGPRAPAARCGDPTGQPAAPLTNRKPTSQAAPLGLTKKLSK